MAPRQPRIGHAPHAGFVGCGALVVRIHRQRRAALTYKVERPFPVGRGQVGVGCGTAHFVIQCISREATTQRHRDQVLHQHIERLLGRCARFDMAFGNRHTRRHALDHFQAVRRHQRDTRRSPRCVARTAGALQQACHAFGRTDLQHAFDRQKINAEVKA